MRSRGDELGRRSCEQRPNELGIDLVVRRLLRRFGRRSGCHDGVSSRMAAALRRRDPEVRHGPNRRGRDVDRASTPPADAPEPEQVVARTPPIAEVLRPVVAGLLGDPSPIAFEFWDGAAPAGRRASARCACARPTRCAGSCACRTSSASAGRTWPATSTSRATCSTSSSRSAMPTPADGTSAARLPCRAVAAAAAGLALPAARRRRLPRRRGSRGWRHSLRRDARAISHHYDVGNDFYRLVLGPTMTYSCARFVDDPRDARRRTGGQARARLPQARAARAARACGCSTSAAAGARWRSTPRAHHGAQVVGITISARAGRRSPAERVAEAGLGDRVEIRLQDYRELGRRARSTRSRRSACPSTSARRASATYFVDAARGCSCRRAGCSTTPSRRSAARGSARTSFVGRYVFPDGELIDVGDVVLAMERGRLRGPRRRVAARALRPHAARLGRQPRGRLGRRRRRSSARAAPRCGACTWRRSAIGFEDGGIAIHQVLGVVPAADGHERRCPRRDDPWD